MRTGKNSAPKRAFAIIMATIMTAALSGAAAPEQGGTPGQGAADGGVQLPQEEVISCTTCELPEEAPALPYKHLRATMYKNLIVSRYPHLLETLKPKEIPGEQGAAGYIQPFIAPGTGGGGYAGTGAGGFSLGNFSVAATLTVPGTNLYNYPVYQTSTSTLYYASAAYNYSELAWAAASARLRSGSLSQNTVIYGHNWGNCFSPFKMGGPQFESLMAYTNQDFAASHQYIYLTTNAGTHTYQIFAVCFTTNLNFYINCNGINTAGVASRAAGMSLYNFGVPVGAGDKLLTLSTCTRYYPGMGANQRFIIMAKLV